MHSYSTLNWTGLVILQKSRIKCSRIKYCTVLHKILFIEMIQSPPKTEDYGRLKGETEPQYMSILSNIWVGIWCVLWRASIPFHPVFLRLHLCEARDCTLESKHLFLTSEDRQWTGSILQFTKTVLKTAHLRTHFDTFSGIILVLCHLYMLKNVLPFLSPGHLLECSSHHRDVLHSQRDPLKAPQLATPLAPFKILN